jgi:hypothetical protein
MDIDQGSTKVITKCQARDNDKKVGVPSTPLLIPLLLNKYTWMHKQKQKVGSDWVHLRLCLSCGHVGCCDSSINKHGTKHFRATGHPIIMSFEPGENWKWCYVDEIFMK